MLSELTELVHLDISDDKDDHPPFDILAPGAKFKISALLQRIDSLPKLHSFDISGKDEIVISELGSFLVSHSNLNFLGLVLTETCKDEMFTDVNNPDFSAQLVVSGFGTEIQILEALKRYLSRPQYIQKTLYYLFKMTT